MTFGTAYNWCDRACERCPLRGECPIPKREAQLRSRDAEGRDPDAPENVLADVAVELERAHAMLVDLDLDLDADADVETDWDVTASRRECAEEAPAVSLRRRQLDEAVLGWCRAMRVLEPIAEARGVERQHDAAQEKYWIVAMKIARISRCAAYQDLDEELVAMDRAPNLLLLERAVAEWNHQAMNLEAVLRVSCSRDANGIESARRAVLRLVAPYLAEIAPEHRRELEQLVQLRRAPSPFAVV